MNTFKAKVNKIILGLTSVGLLILLIFPVSLYANHFRYGTMSWELAENDNDTIILSMENGWTANHGDFRELSDYDHQEDTHIGSIHRNEIEVFWGDGDSDRVDIKIITRSSQYTSAACGASVDQTLDQCKDSTNSVMGDNASSQFTLGKSHDYNNGSFVIYWTSSARAAVHSDQSGNGNTWRNETLVRIGGDYIGNVSPVSAVPAIVQVQDNQTFIYQVNATDANGDNLTYRWGKMQEFFVANGTGNTNTFTKPTGMTLSGSGLIEWDVRDNNSGLSTVEDDLWNAVIMVEDRLDNGTAKSYIPIDFFFKVTDPSNFPPSFTQFPTGTQTVVIGDNKTFTIKSRDDSGHPPTISVLNPPSTDNSSSWDNSSSISADNETTFLVHFAPNNTSKSSYVVNFRSTDSVGMTKDKSLSINVSSVANEDPTAPTLVSPADNSTVTNPVLFQWEKSTDADNDNVSYTLYVCDNREFDGCSGTSVTAGVNFVPPFNQNPHDSLISWPSTLHAEMISEQISQDFSMIPKLVIMLGVLGLLGVIISLSVKNISHRRIIYMLFLIIIGTVSCMANYNEIDEDSNTSDTTETTALTLSEVTAVTTPTTDKTPDYTFSSTKAGTITYGGSCTSSITECFKGNNTITFSTLSYGTYDNCTITVTDSDNSSSSPLAITAFTVFTNDVTYTYSNLTPDTYYWKVVASDPKGGTANSATWSFHIQ